MTKCSLSLHLLFNPFLLCFIQELFLLKDIGTTIPVFSIGRAHSPADILCYALSTHEERDALSIGYSSAVDV